MPFGHDRRVVPVHGRDSRPAKILGNHHRHLCFVMFFHPEGDCFQTFAGFAVQDLHTKDVVFPFRLYQQHHTGMILAGAQGQHIFFFFRPEFRAGQIIQAEDPVQTLHNQCLFFRDQQFPGGIINAFLGQQFPDQRQSFPVPKPDARLITFPEEQVVSRAIQEKPVVIGIDHAHRRHRILSGAGSLVNAQRLAQHIFRLRHHRPVLLRRRQRLPCQGHGVQRIVGFQLLFRSHTHHIGQRIQIFGNGLEGTVHPLGIDLLIEVALFHAADALADIAVAPAAVAYCRHADAAPPKQDQEEPGFKGNEYCDEQTQRQHKRHQQPFPNHRQQHQ